LLVSFLASFTAQRSSSYQTAQLPPVQDGDTLDDSRFDGIVVCFIDGAGCSPEQKEP
jgi:hypothetical protein